MIYKVIVSNIKSEIIKSLVFKNFDLVKEYFKETFPFYNRDVTDNCISQSFTISNNGKPLYFINISRIEPITKISKKKPKAYGRSTYSIFEIFNNEDAPIITKKFKKYIKQMKSKEDCVDSFRIGLIEDKQSMKEYHKLVTCCGSNDTKVIINGKEYMFGCNYGH